MAYTAYIKGLLHDPAPHGHPILSNMVTGRIKKYQDAQLIISSFLNQEALKKLYSDSTSREQGHKRDGEYSSETKQSRFKNRRATLEPMLPPLLTMISYVYQAIKDFWISSASSQAPGKQHIAGNNCNYHHDNDHNTKTAYHEGFLPETN